ncbi:hypothetical protein H8R23_14475 [Flavobacterium sp. F-380]|uniref:Uncharacterized protein n=1 Tax=Flavobacterium kayseriense TaxID=2764714 RepID=A0ABR7JAZ1_9FLAO|nr:hypothetical protein [Flavobacterium kayseriense]MBC5842616.1 hypothetical protein [Flavobacterium kayseriense]MBC5849146.1 hypothetical protein [Flavobacterium kayseriense]
METKILNIILDYFSRAEDENALFKFTAYELSFKYRVLFKELEKEIKFNLESVNIENYIYLNYLKEKLYKTYSEEKFRNYKYFTNNSIVIHQIYADSDLLKALKYPLTNKCQLTPEEDYYCEKQSEFLDALKNNFLYELLIYINSIDLNNDSIYNNLKRKKSSKNYSLDYLDSYCELLNSGTPFQAYTYNYYSKNIFEHFSDMFKKEFEGNNKNFRNNNDFNFDEYIGTCLNKIKSSKSFEPENKSIYNFIDERYFDRDLYLNNDHLDEILSTHKYVYDDDPDNYNNEFISGYNDYYLMLEADKMIEFITKQSSELVRCVAQDIPPIFNSKKGFAIFNYVLNELDINVLTIDKRPNQTLLNAFWHSSKAKEEIFKIQMSMNDYLEYLNQIFNKRYKSRTMSNGIKKVDIIEDYIGKYKIN